MRAAPFSGAGDPARLDPLPPLVSLQLLAASLAAAAAASDSDADDGVPSSDGEGAPWEGGVVHVSAADEAALAAFARPEGSVPARTLADVILDRIKERQEAGEAGEGGEDDDAAAASDIDARLADVYRGVGRVLSRYTAGALPKAFKVVPSLRDWEGVLALTEPDLWSPHATFQATRLFVSSLNSKMV